MKIKEALEHPIEKVRQSFYQSYTAATLKILIIGWAIFIILLVLFVVDNPWILAGILAYEILP